MTEPEDQSDRTYQLNTIQKSSIRENLSFTVDLVFAEIVPVVVPKSVLVVGMTPVLVVDITPDLVVDIIPDLVVEMIPDLPKLVAETAKTNKIVQERDLTFFIVLLLVT